MMGGPKMKLSTAAKEVEEWAIGDVSFTSSWTALE
jgi:hypothetical protein